MRQIPATTRESDAFSHDLKRRGLSFVGSTVIYGHMQAVGLVYDHLVDCFRCRTFRSSASASNELDPAPVVGRTNAKCEAILQERVWLLLVG